MGLKIELTCTAKSPPASAEAFCLRQGFGRQAADRQQAGWPLFALRVRLRPGRAHAPEGGPMGRRPKRGNSVLWYLFPAESRQREVGRDFVD